MPKVLKYTSADSFTSQLFVVGGTYETGLLRIGELSLTDSTHSWKTPLVDTETGPSVNFKIVALDSTHFVLVYSDGTTGYGSAKIGHWDGASDVIWDTGETLFQHTPVSMSENVIDAIKLSSVYFVIAYIAEDDSKKIKLRIGQFDTNRILWLTTSEFDVDEDCDCVSIKYISGLSFLVSYEKDNAVYVRLYTWLGGNNLSAATDPILVNSGVASSVNCMMLSATRFAIFWSSGTQGLVRIGSITGSTIGWETVTEEFLNHPCSYISSERLTDLYFIVACRDVTDSGHGKVRAAFWDGTSIIWIGEAIPFRRTSIKYLSSTVLGEHLFLMLYCDEGFSQCGVLTKGRLGSLVSTTTTTSSTTTASTTSAP